MSTMTRFGLVLGIICLIATLVLALTYEVTRPKIEEQMRLEEEAALKSVMPLADSFNKKSINGIDYYEAIKGDKPAGYCLPVLGSGYSGYIRMIAGIDPSGVITGLEIVEQHETPGLGTKIDEVRRGEKEPYFLRQFKGKQARTIVIKRDIDAITGATISSRAVTEAVSKAVGKFLNEVT